METHKDNSTDQMIIGNCVSCEGLVRIPVNANPNSTVKCPRCNEVFTLELVLDQLAPVLEVVDTPKKSWFHRKDPKPATIPIIDSTVPQPSDRKPGDKFTVSPILSKGAKRKKRRRSSSRSGAPGAKNGNRKPDVHKNEDVNSTSRSEPSLEPSLVFADRNEEPHRESTAGKPTPQTVRQRPTRPSQAHSSSSGGLEMTKVIFGAMLAIPVAQMLIWWFAGTDPLGLGPYVGKVAPFVVPAEFRVDEDSDLDKIFENEIPSIENDN